MPDPNRHAESRNWFESILRFIPGFRGYLGKEYRRESDYLARTWLADRLQQSKRGLDDFMRGLADAGQIDHLPQCERVRTRLDGLISRMRGEVRGYSGLFDFVKVREDLLDDVYNLDMSLMSQVDSLAASIEQLSVKPDAPSAVVSDLLQRIDEVERKFAQRSDLLKGLGPQ